MSVTRASLFSEGIHSGMSAFAVATTIGKRMRGDDLRADYEVAPKKPRMGGNPRLNARSNARHQMKLKEFHHRRELRIKPTTKDTGDGLMEYLTNANHKPLVFPLFGSTMEERRARAITALSPASSLSSRGSCFDYNSASPSRKRMWNRMVEESMGDLRAEGSFMANSPPRKRPRSSGSGSPSGSNASSSSPLSETSGLSADSPEVPIPFIGSLARRLQIQNRRPPRSAGNAATGETQRRAQRARRVDSAPTVPTPNNELNPAIWSTGPRDVFDMTSSPLLNMETTTEARRRPTLTTARVNDNTTNAPVAQRRRSAGDTASVVNNAANIQAGQRGQLAGNVPLRRAPGSPLPAQNTRLVGSANGQNRTNNTARPRASRNLGSLPSTPIRMETASHFSPSTRSIRSAAPTPPETAGIASETAPIEAHEAAQPQPGPNRTQEAPVTVTEIMAALERLQVRVEEEPSADLDRQISDLLEQLRLMQVEEDDSWIAD